jgi:hypothetical protein
MKCLCEVNSQKGESREYVTVKIWAETLLISFQS